MLGTLESIRGTDHRGAASPNCLHAGLSVRQPNEQQTESLSAADQAPGDAEGDTFTAGTNALPEPTEGAASLPVADALQLDSAQLESMSGGASLQQGLIALADLAGHGGPVLLVLAALSVVALTIVLVKLLQFARLRLNARQPVETALGCWYRGDSEGALAAVHGSRQPSARLVARAISGLRQTQAQSATGLDLLREELARDATAQLEQLRSWLRALEVIAALSPLLGLLGTVLGMIEAFRQLASAGSQVDPALLSGGIWQALLTTAAGLSVAIPLVLLHSWLERRVERCAHHMEDAVTRIFTLPLSEPTDDVSAPRPRQPALTAVETTAGSERHAVSSQA